MNIQEAYNTWADSYDTVLNKTRDLEARAIRAVVPEGHFSEILELGCGTGKNTEWLATRAAHLTAVDFSAKMLLKAQQKLPQPHITFQQADITQPWEFVAKPADLITCSLILEHIQDLNHILPKPAKLSSPTEFSTSVSCIPSSNTKAVKPASIRLRGAFLSWIATSTTFPTIRKAPATTALAACDWTSGLMRKVELVGHAS